MLELCNENMTGKKSFNILKNSVKTRRCTLPWLVAVSKNPNDETEEQFTGNFEKLSKLSENTKNKLVSEVTSEKIQSTGKQFNLQLLQIADIARAVRSYYFSELKLEDMPQVLAQEMGIDIGKAQEITNSVIKNIIQDDSYIKTTTYENLPLSQALQKFPALGEKLISGNPIRIKFFPGPVRPSIKNWITDYHAEVGAGSHESIERGNYLYHSENAKNLISGERQKLAVILKSLDENEPVSVDAERQEIVFPHPETLSQRERGILGKPPLPLGEDAQRAGEGERLRFAYPQKLSSESFPRQARLEPPRPPSPPASPASPSLGGTSSHRGEPRPPEIPRSLEPEARYRPYQIHHLSPDGQLGESEDEEKKPRINGNVVDLRNN